MSYKYSYASSFNVTKTDDTTDGICDADCSLREAIIAANNAPGTDIIFIPSGIYKLTEDLDITDSITIRGTSDNDTILDGNMQAVIFKIKGPITVNINDLTVMNGKGEFDSSGGAGVSNLGGIVNISDCAIMSNKSEGEGGGIRNFNGDMTIINSTISGNFADYGGGGISIFKGKISIINSTISHNGGGGILNWVGNVNITNCAIFGNSASVVDSGLGISNGGEMIITNSSITGNGDFSGQLLDSNGGGIHNSGKLKLNSCTITDNAAFAFQNIESGGGIFNSNDGKYSFGEVELQNTILAGNIAVSGMDCAGTITSLGNNIIGNLNGCDISLLESDLTGDPGLGMFIEDKGHFQVSSNSQAIDAGNSASCSETDQLGIPRSDGNDDGIVTCDIGAIEFVTGFSSYNDLAWKPGQLDHNITMITSPNGNSILPSFSELSDFSTDQKTGITLTVDGGTFDGTNQALHGREPKVTDAYDAFFGKVSTTGAISYINKPDSPLALMFEGLDTAKSYTIIFYVDRAKYGWDRAGLVTLAKHNGFKNRSSSGRDNQGNSLFDGSDDNSTRLPSDNVNGYIARFTNVIPNTSGEIMLTVNWDGKHANRFKGKYANAIMIEDESTGNIAYNDLAWKQGQLDNNITMITSPNGDSGLPNTGELIDFSSGIGTGIMFTVNGGSFNGKAQASHGKEPKPTDAHTVFNGKINTKGAISYINKENSPLELMFDGLNPDNKYTIAFYADRGAYDWNRASLVTLVNHKNFINESSAGYDNYGNLLFNGPLDPSTRLPSSNRQGYIACFTKVVPDLSGKVGLSVSWDGEPSSEFKGKYASAVMIKEKSNNFQRNSIVSLKTKTPINIDGLIYSDIWPKANSIYFSDPSRSDNFIRVSTVYDDNYLYFLFEIFDLISEVSNEKLWKDDGVEIFLDTAHDATQSMNDDDYHFIVNIEDMVSGGAIMAKTVRPLTEIAIPWTTIETIPTPNKIMGILLGNNDRDNGISVQFDWNGLIDTGSYRRPNLWGDLTLSSKEISN